MPARVGLRPAALIACTKVYAAAIPYSTLPSHGRLWMYWSWIFLKSVIQGFEASVTSGRQGSGTLPVGGGAPAAPLVNFVNNPVGGVPSDPTLLTAQIGRSFRLAAVTRDSAV